MMKSMWVRWGLALVVLAAPSVAGGKSPIPVSPGSVDGFSSAGSPCPTFSWSAVAGAGGYEVVVYSAAEGELGAAGRGGGEVAPVLRKSLPGGALSWTPPAESCLEPSGTYAWAVRALGNEAAGAWSESALFKVAPGPALGRGLVGAVERAVGRYLERRGLSFERGGELAALLSEELAGGRTRAASSPAPAAVRQTHRGGRRLLGDAPAPEGVFAEDVELWLEETGNGLSDKVQLVFATPEFDGLPRDGLADAWTIVVEAEDSSTAGSDAGTFFISAPSFADPLQLFTDGSVVLGELRKLALRKLSGPPTPSGVCGLSQEGFFYWDVDISALCVCDGESWAPIDSDNMGSCS